MATKTKSNPDTVELLKQIQQRIADERKQEEVKSFLDEKQLQFMSMIFSRCYEVAVPEEAIGLSLVQLMFEYELASRDKTFDLNKFRENIGYEWVQESLRNLITEHHSLH